MTEDDDMPHGVSVGPWETRSYVVPARGAVGKDGDYYSEIRSDKIAGIVLGGSSIPAKVEVTITAPGFAPQTCTFEGGGGIVLYNGVVILP